MSGADKNDCADWCVLPADHDGPCRHTTDPLADFLARRSHMTPVDLQRIASAAVDAAALKLNQSN